MLKGNPLVIITLIIIGYGMYAFQDSFAENAQRIGYGLDMADAGVGIIALVILWAIAKFFKFNGEYTFIYIGITFLLLRIPTGEILYGVLFVNIIIASILSGRMLWGPQSEAAGKVVLMLIGIVSNVTLSSAISIEALRRLIETYRG